MKRQFGLLLASALLVFALAACGDDDNDASRDSGEQNTAGESIQDAGDSLKDAGKDILDAGEDVLRPDSDREKDAGERKDSHALTDGSASADATGQKGQPGVTYGQMLRNAHVHDTDGLLKDGENSVSPGAA